MILFRAVRRRSSLWHAQGAKKTVGFLPEEKRLNVATISRSRLFHYIWRFLKRQRMGEVAINCGSSSQNAIKTFTTEIRPLVSLRRENGEAKIIGPQLRPKLSP